MTERPTTAAIQHALACDPATPGNGRLCQELLATLLGKPITRKPAPIEPLNDRPCQRAQWTDDRRARFRATLRAKREMA